MDELIGAVGIKRQITEPVRQRSESPGEIDALQRKVKRLTRERDDDGDFYKGKIRQLKR